VFITTVPNTKLFAWGEEESGLAISGVPGSKGRVTEIKKDFPVPGNFGEFSRESRLSSTKWTVGWTL
jgi:hypothetical protein